MNSLVSGQTADREINSQALLDRRSAARHLIRHPLVRSESEPAMFTLIRRHEHELDRWFTQRLGYRLQTTADTARLFKSTVVAHRRPLVTATSQPRPFAQREYTMLALALAAIAAGPNVISLHDLVHEIRSAAADAAVALIDDAADRRALVTALRWLIHHGVVVELHERVDRYITDDAADAVLKLRPDRVALLPLSVLSRAGSADDLVDRSDLRSSPRSWMRARLVEDSVLYRSDLTDEEWSELRRRMGEESNLLGEMFDLHLEARSEGIAAIDADGSLTDQRFPTTGTVGHTALLLIERLSNANRASLRREELVGAVRELAREYRRFWSQLADTPERLADDVVDLLLDHRLAVMEGDGLRMLPAAWRYSVVTEIAEAAQDSPDQGSLW